MSVVEDPESHMSAVEDPGIRTTAVEDLEFVCLQSRTWNSYDCS